MESTLRAVQNNPALRLQLVVTGMHLDRSRGGSIDAIRQRGWTIDAVAPWRAGARLASETAVAMGRATAALAAIFAELRTDIVLITGDRVEAFAAAAAAHVSGLLVAHVHGGDRALGLVDDSLRHAITKLAHLHFPATRQSASRILKLGEDRWRIVRAGAPGLDGIRAVAHSRAALAQAFPNLRPRRYALLVLHPETSNAAQESQTADLLLQCVEQTGFERTVIVYPNNDPGSEGIAGCWDALPVNERVLLCRDLPRERFLGLLRDTAVLVGNSSSGIIEAATFGTPVLDIGSRQAGRERGANVLHSAVDERAIRRALRRIWNGGHPIRFPRRNLYGSGGAARIIADTLANLQPERYRRKLIAY